jgi:hypothetical protein
MILLNDTPIFFCKFRLLFFPNLKIISGNKTYVGLLEGVYICPFNIFLLVLI